MKDVKELVCSPMQARLLREFGIKQNSVFYYKCLMYRDWNKAQLFVNTQTSGDSYRVPCFLETSPLSYPIIASAFTLQELLQLIDRIDLTKLLITESLQTKLDDADFMFKSNGINATLCAEILILALEQKKITTDELNRLL